jgi:hypothetical protein
MGAEKHLTADRLYLALVLTAFVAMVEPTTAFARELTPVEARDLVLKALETQGIPQSPGVTVDGPGGEFSGFYDFDVTLQTATRPPIHVGTFEVNRKTADVWEWGVWCHGVEARPLKALQESLRKKIDLSEAEYRSLSRVAFCSESPQRPWIVVKIESVKPVHNGFQVLVNVKNNGRTPVILVQRGRERPTRKTFPVRGLEIHQWNGKLGWEELAPMCFDVPPPERPATLKLQGGETARDRFTVYTALDPVHARMCTTIRTARAGAKVRAVLYDAYESESEAIGLSRLRPPRVQSVSRTVRLPAAL